MIWSLIFLVGAGGAVSSSGPLASSDNMRPTVIDHYVSEKDCADAKKAINRGMMGQRIIPFGNEQMICVPNNPIAKG